MLRTHSMGRSASVALLLLAVSAAAFARPAPVRPSERGPYGPPVRLRNLTDLNLVMYNSDLSGVQRLEVQMGWLAAERRDPSPTVKGLSGGPIDSDYIQEQLIIGMGVYTDVGALDWLLNSGQVDDEDMRDALRLALAFCGDLRQVGPLIAMLRTDPSPGHRCLAAERLGLLGATEAIPALEQALSDNYAVSYADWHHGDTTDYPVRRSAREALHVLRNPELLAQARQHSRAFRPRVAAARKALAKNRAALHGLVLAANGKRYGSRKIARVQRAK